ncbi:DUF2442 domain-containing protein [bacterium]|nr:DUF2442 domain-containing protein [bacterium]
MILHILEAKIVEKYRIWLKFNDGVEGEVDLENELYGEMFTSLLDQDNFKNFKIDEEIATIVWENGADLAPEFLYDKMEILTKKY